MFGPVLTHTSDVFSFVKRVHEVGDSAKVITAWGASWEDNNNRCKLLANVRHVLVRTVAGDPSVSGAHSYLIPDQVEKELAPWLSIKPALMVELGNEPDILGNENEMAIWTYSYWLNQTIDAIRASYPEAFLIAPSPRIQVNGWQRWLEITRPVLTKCDAISLHIYGYYTLEDKGELRDALPVYRRMFGDKPIYITEAGINDKDIPAGDKIRAYQEFAKNKPADIKALFYFHHDENNTLGVHAAYSV